MSFTTQFGWLIAIAFAMSVNTVVSAADDTASFRLHNAQLHRLQQPSNYQTTREQKQHVYVYVGLHDKDVDAALDRHFNRIENFLFASVIVTDEDGQPVYKDGHVQTESDDC